MISSYIYLYLGNSVERNKPKYLKELVTGLVDLANFTRMMIKQDVVKWCFLVLGSSSVNKVTECKNTNIIFNIHICYFFISRVLPTFPKFDQIRFKFIDSHRGILSYLTSKILMFQKIRPDSKHQTFPAMNI